MRIASTNFIWSVLSCPVELSEYWEQVWLRNVSYQVYYGQQCFGSLLAIAFFPVSELELVWTQTK